MQRTAGASRRPSAASSERLVLDGPARFDSAGRVTTTFGVGVVDAAGKLAAAKPPNTTEWIAPMRAHGKHRDHGLRNHRHVDDHPVARRTPSRASAPANADDLVSSSAKRRMRDGSVTGLS